MKAKKINEAIVDILKPKSKEDLEISMVEHLGKYKDIIDNCYEFVEANPDHFEVNEDLGLHYDGYSNWYGFSFFNLFDEGEYVIEFVEDEDSPSLSKTIVMNQRNGETFKNINSLDDFMFFFKVYELIEESVIDVLMPKSTEEMKSSLPAEAEELVDDCYQLVRMNPNYEIEHELGFYQGIYGFYFNTKKPLEVGNEHHLGEIGEYTVGYFTELKDVYFFFENNGYDHKIEKLEDLQMLLIGEDDDYDPRRTNESVANILTPLPEDIIRKKFEEEFPIFAKLFHDMFPGEKFSVEPGQDGVDANFSFSVDDNGKKIQFIVNQNRMFEVPTISYLRETPKSHGISGFFTGQKVVKTPEDVRNYIKSHIN